jgi:diguanylate cyclase (GGDEF)-like protein
MGSQRSVDLQQLSAENQGKDYLADSVRRYVTRLRFQFLTPIVLTLALVVLVIIAIVYFFQYKRIDSDVVELQSTASQLYRHSIEGDTRALQTVMDLLKTDEELVNGLAKLDRIRLLRRAASVYEDINRHYGVTHFYFTDPDRVNLLRVHKPEKYGDTINRQTTLTAQRGGADAYGIELGPLGTLTLRYVQPWYDKETRGLLGFVELGMEVDQTVNSIRDLFGIDVFVLIKKEFLDRRGWEEGMRTFNHAADWDRFPQVVAGMHGSQVFPEILATQIEQIDFSQLTSVLKVYFEQSRKYGIFQPLQNVNGQNVGIIVMLLDTYNTSQQARSSIVIGSIAVITVASLLILFFYWFVGRIGERLARNEWQLEQIATHDGLTGLFNRRQFNLMLEDAIDSHTRYDHPTSLLMIDIDYFKKVNDTYGHQAGDTVLVELARRTTGLARSVDRVCRYGGEEFVLILPETTSDGALIFAQRLRAAMADEPWNLGDGSQISLTVSVGFACCPDHADNAEALIQAADKALYAAKLSGRNRVINFADIGQAVADS